ncbi:MAG: hypothetical protein ABIK92_11810 [Pseudomonadota bacterium]
MHANISIGDKVRIYNKEDFKGLMPGFYEMYVIDEDSNSFAVDSFEKLWFCRHSGKSYAGNATVIKKLLV